MWHPPAWATVFADLAQMEDILAGTGLDWTVIRPPQLTGKPLTGTYRTAYGQNLRGGLSVPRADAAHLMLRVVGQPRRSAKPSESPASSSMPPPGIP